MAGVQNFEGSLDVMIKNFVHMSPGGDQFAGKDPLDVLDGFIGLHVRDDLVAHLGSVWGAYMADSTGGGGLASFVLFVELSDAAGLVSGLERIEGLVDSAGAMQARGYVRLERSEGTDADLWSLTFPGVPVPMELTLSVTPQHLLVAMTPQAALAGLRQLAGGGPSLLDDPEYQKHAPALQGDEVAFSYFDSPALLADGYGWATMLASALSNGVRSRTDEGRQAGIVLPAYADLLARVAPHGRRGAFLRQRSRDDGRGSIARCSSTSSRRSGGSIACRSPSCSVSPAWPRRWSRGRAGSFGLGR